MATYLTISNKFNPYTYEELLKPYQDLLEAYDTKMNALEDLLTKTSLWDGILDETADKEYYRAFEEYSNKLKSLIDVLGNGEASDITKKDLHQLKLEYSKIFAPLDIKYQDLKRAREEQRKTRLQANAAGRDIDFTKDMETTSLTQAMTDPNWNIYGTILYDDIAKDALTAGTVYGDLELGYRVYGEDAGYEAPIDAEQYINELITHYTPAGASLAIKEKISNIITSQFENGRLGLIGATAYNKLLEDKHSREYSRTVQELQRKQINQTGRNYKLEAAKAGLKYDPKTNSYVIDPNTVKGREAIYGKQTKEELDLEERYEKATGIKKPRYEDYKDNEEFTAALIQYLAGLNEYNVREKAAVKAAAEWKATLELAGYNSEEEFVTEFLNITATKVGYQDAGIDTNDYIKVEGLTAKDREKGEDGNLFRNADKDKNLTPLSDEEKRQLYWLKGYLVKKGVTPEFVTVYKSSVGSGNYVIKYDLTAMSAESLRLSELKKKKEKKEKPASSPAK